MRSLCTAAALSSPHSSEDPAQSEINKCILKGHQSYSIRVYPSDQIELCSDAWGKGVGLRIST